MTITDDNTAVTEEGITADNSSPLAMMETFRRRTGARIVFLGSSVQEICKAWDAHGDVENKPIMKPYRFRRVMSSTNPTLVDLATVSMIVGVSPRVLLLGSSDVSELEDAEAPTHLKVFRMESDGSSGKSKEERGE